MSDSNPVRGPVIAIGSIIAVAVVMLILFRGSDDTSGPATGGTAEVTPGPVGSLNVPRPSGSRGGSVPRASSSSADSPRHSDGGPPLAPGESYPEGSLAVAGMCVDPAGNGVPGVRLMAFPLIPGLGNPQGSDDIRETVSQEHGRFAFRGIPPWPARRFSIVSHNDSRWIIENPVIVECPDDSVLVPVRRIFDQGTLVGQVVMGAAEQPVAGFKVRIQEMARDKAIFESVSDSSGRFSITDLMTGSYRILTPPPGEGPSLRMIRHPAAPGSTVAALGVVSISERTPLESRTLVVGGPLRLRGRVIDEVTAQPLAGVRLMAVEGTQMRTTKPFEKIVVETGQDGRFAFEDIGPAIRPNVDGGGIVGLALRDDRWMLTDARGGARDTYSDLDDGLSWISFEDMFASEVSDIELLVVRGATMTGKVVKTDGEPYPGAVVFVTQRTNRIMMSPGLVRSKATSGPEGEFSFRVPVFQTLYAGARTREGGIYFSEPAPILENGADVTIVIAEDQDISGVVRNPQGQPVPEAEVTLALMNGKAIRTVPSDADGRFHLTRPGGTVATLQAFHERYFSSEPVETSDLKDPNGYVLELAEPGTVRGYVVDSGDRPVAGALISLVNVGTREFPSTQYPYSDETGRFELGPLRQGRPYILRASQGNVQSTERDFFADGPERKIVLQLDFLINCIVLVTDMQDNPVPEYQVTLHEAEDLAAAVHPSGDGPWFVENPDGRIDLQLSPRSDMFFEITTTDYGATTSALLDWDHISSLVHQRELTFEFPIKIGGEAAVFGRVVSQGSNGVGIQGLTVELIPNLKATASNPYSAVTSAEGGFRFEEVPTGGYELSIAPPDVTAMTQRPVSRFPVYVSASGEVDLGDIPYAGVGRLEINVTDAGGQPAAGIWIEVTGGFFGAAPVKRQTDSRGYATWEDVPEGKYVATLPTHSQKIDVDVLHGETTMRTVKLGGYEFEVAVQYGGRPMPEAWVRVESATGESRAEAQTNVAGRAKFEGLPAGDFSVDVMWPGSFFASEGVIFGNPFRPVTQTVTLSEETVDNPPLPTFQMPSGRITGALTDDFRVRLESPIVRLYLYDPVNPNQRIEVTTDGSGRFVFPGVPVGQFEILQPEYQYKVPVSLTAEGQTVTGIAVPGPDAQY